MKATLPGRESKRLFVPGLWGRTGHAIRLQGYAHCTGGCHGGRRGCDCATGCVEMACDVAPDAERVIQPPEPLSDDMRARFKRRALYLSALGFGALAGLLEAFGASTPARPKRKSAAQLAKELS